MLRPKCPQMFREESRNLGENLRADTHLLTRPKQVKHVEGDIPDSPPLLLLGQEAELGLHLRTGSGLHPAQRELVSEESFQGYLQQTALW